MKTGLDLNQSFHLIWIFKIYPGKIAGCLKKEGTPLNNVIFLWVFGVHMCVLFIYQYLSVFSVFYGKDLVLMDIINRYVDSTRQ